MKSSAMTSQSAGAFNGLHASLMRLPVGCFSSPVVFSEANVLNRLIGQTHDYERFLCRMLTCHCADTEIAALTSSHLLASKQLSLVLVDNGVTRGRSAILVAGNRTLEISRVGQTVGSCRVTIRNGFTDVVPSVRLFPFRPLGSCPAGS